MSACAESKGHLETGLMFKIHGYMMGSYRIKQGTLPPLCPQRSLPGCQVARVSTVLTEVVRISQVEDVAAVHVMVQGLLDQVLWLVPSQLGHPGEGQWLRELQCPADCISFKLTLVFPANQVLKGLGGGWREC